MVHATSRSVVAQVPRVVHHGQLAQRGTPLIPASISPIQWKPGTQMGRPPGFAGNHRAESFGLQTVRFFEHRPLPQSQHGLARFLQTLDEAFGPLPQEHIDQ
ncbi:MAG TPA: hypothetical protein VGF67_27660 [Ktedonobacteraceae bacterium]